MQLEGVTPLAIVVTVAGVVMMISCFDGDGSMETFRACGTGSNCSIGGFDGDGVINTSIRLLCALLRTLLDAIGGF